MERSPQTISHSHYWRNVLLAGLAAGLAALCSWPLVQPQPGGANSLARRELQRGVAAARRNELDRALALVTRAAERAQAQGNHAITAKALLRQGRLLDRRGDGKSAAAAFEAALGHARRVPSVGLEAEAFVEIASQQSRERPIEEARDGYLRAATLAQQAHDARLEAQVLNSLGVLYLQLTDYGRALTTFQHAAAVDPKDALQTAYIRNNLGFLYGMRDEGELADTSFRAALAEFERLGDSYGTIRALNNLGASSSGGGDYDRAEAYIRRALALAEEQQDAQALPGHWHNLGVLQETAGRYAEAVAAHRESLRLAEQIQDPVATCDARLGIAHALNKQGRLEEALTEAEAAVSCSARARQRELFWQARSLAGTIHARREEVREAEAAFEEAIATIEALSLDAPLGAPGQPRYPRGQLGPFYELASLLVEAGRPAEALTVLEAAKSRALLTATELKVLPRAPALKPHPDAAEQRLERRLIELNGELMALRSSGGDPIRARELAALQHRARLALSGYYSRASSISPSAVRGALAAARWAPDSAAGDPTWTVEYAVLEERTLAFLLEPSPEGGTPRVRAISIALGEAELATLATQLRDRVTARREDFAEPGAALYAALLAPLGLAGRPIPALRIIPDGPLWEVPFELLTALEPGSFLAAAPLSVAPSLTALATLSRRGARATPDSDVATLLVVANPEVDGGGGGLAPLPEATDEALTLAEIYGTARSTFLVGSAASEARVKRELGRHHILHFGTHALVDDRSPMFSSLVLAQEPSGSGEDGLLEAWEVSSLALEADLVVLAACETARGKFAPGEGVRGLAWAFAAAGSPAIVASQWPVDSVATRRLTIEFHRQLEAGRSSAEALKLAAAAVRAAPGFAHPVYWAGFTLVGDGGAVPAPRTQGAARARDPAREAVPRP